MWFYSVFLIACFIDSEDVWYRPVEIKKILGGGGGGGRVSLLKNVGQLAKENRSIEMA